jgi:hypothetical protein
MTQAFPLRIVALVYNWWSLYARLVNPDKHHEAVTSRPLMLQSIGRKTTHAGQTTVTVTSTHAKAPVIQAAMQELTRFFKELINSAEQLDVSERIRLIAQRAFVQEIAGIFTTSADTEITTGYWLMKANCRF